MPGQDPSPADAATAGPGVSPTASRDRTDLDEFGGDPDVRFPDESEDPAMTTADRVAGGNA